MYKFLIIPVFLFSTVLFGQIPDEVMESWMGAHQSEIIKSWGPPDKITSDGKGGKILIYITQSGEKYTEQGHYETSYATGYPVREYHPGREVDNRYYLYRMFYVNQRGIIYYYRWKHE